MLYDKLTALKNINNWEKIPSYNLASRKGVDENDREKTYLTRYKAAIAFLTKVAEGLINIGVSGISKESLSKTGFSMKSSDRLFTRNSMKGW